YQAAAASFERAFKSLNDRLATRTFLVGDRVTVADIAVVCTLVSYYVKVIDAAYAAKYPHVNRWFHTCVNQPHFKSVLGTIDFCKSAPVVAAASSVPATGGAIGKLHTYPGEIDRTAQSLIAAKYNGVSVQVEKADTKSAAFLAKFPLGKAPAFEGADGSLITESTAILRYVALANPETTLYGSSKKEAALVESYLYTSAEFYRAQVALLYPAFGYSAPATKESVEASNGNVARHLAYLNTQLATRTYLVGERVTLADIQMVSALLNIVKHALEPKAFAEYKNVHRWFNTCVNQPHFKSVLGTVQYSKLEPAKAAPSATPAKKEKAPSATPAKKESAPK
ncbi:Elongation factor 1-gamma, partial [Kappamyces sp. JEL0680]